MNRRLENLHFYIRAIFLIATLSISLFLVIDKKPSKFLDIYLDSSVFVAYFAMWGFLLWEAYLKFKNRSK
jgi:hypothetical protein